MFKKELRLDYRKKRSSLEANLVESYSLKITNGLLRLPIWNLSFYHIFLSIRENKEVDTTPILTVLQGKDKNIVVPKIAGENDLKNYLLTDSTVLRPNTLQIPEPIEGIEIEEKKIDVVFVPLMAFDEMGNRVGYGKGYYDTFLRKCRPDIIKVGLSFFGAVPVIADISKNDVPLNYCITPEKNYAF